jgi:non-specific serine/threonine protein kinase/serine/threonine-protein kinase
VIADPRRILDFPVTSGPSDTTRLDAPSDDPVRGRRIGPYRLVRELGQGGMGAVFLAVRDDDVFHKRVALKLLKRGMDTDAIVRRFRTERQILAGLDHPNIARLLDGGTTDDGLPYLVMEFVEGAPLVEYANARGLDVAARLELFLPVCAAVQHAHQNLVIHRDLKPANVLVTAEGVPKLLDFGIAKLLNPEMAGQTLAPTAPGLQLMTPEYASPEQVRGETVTTTSDVYSLGVLLYEFLTGRLPYRLTSRAVSEIVRVVCEEEPVRPSEAVTRPVDVPPADARPSGGRPSDARPSGRSRSTGLPDSQRLQRRLEGDLDNIVLKALSKEPARRYASVDQFAEDLRRHLAGLPVLARQDTFGYRASKFVRRHRGAVTAGAAVLLALVTGLVGVAWQAQVARAERRRAEQRFNDVRALANAFLFDVHDAVKDLAGSTPARQLMVQKGIEYLDKIATDAGDRADLRRELAAGYVRVGDVQGRPLNPNLGDTAGALASYRKAVALYDSLGVTAASPSALRRDVATALLRLSELLAATSDTDGAMQAVRRAMDLQKDITTDASAPAEARRDLAVSYSRLGDMLASTGATSDALEAQRLALGIMEQLAALAPDDPNNLRQLGVAYHKVGNVLGNPNYPNLGDHASALEQMRKSVATFERASARYPDNAMFKRNLAVARSNSADILVALGRRDEAMAEEALARETYEAQVREDPTNAAARNDLAIAYYKQAEMHDADGRFEEALAAIDRAATIQDQLAAASPESARARGEVATNNGLRGRILAKLGRRAAAQTSLDRAVTLCRELAAANPGNVERKVYVALALIERGDAALVLAGMPGGGPADRAAARRDYTEAEQIMAALDAAGAIEGTDLDTLRQVRAKLAGLAAR